MEKELNFCEVFGLMRGKEFCAFQYVFSTSIHCISGVLMQFMLGISSCSIWLGVLLKEVTPGSIVLSG